MITLEDVSYEYPGTLALDRVGFDLEAGSITALVGPNGAGKTTLLRCIAALDEPLAGRIHVDGIDVVEHPRACHRRIGYLSDFFGLYRRLTVRQGLAYVAAAQGVAEAAIPAAVERAAGELGVADKLETLAGTLSRGQRQRVAIAQALVHAPPVLLLDEPASGLDPEARHELAALFTTLGTQGMTILVSSHILAELSEYCTGMLILREGRVHEHGALGGRAAPREHLRIGVAEAPAGWPQPLAAQPGVTVLTHDELGAEIELAGDRAARAELLRALVGAGIPVTELIPLRDDLQRQYLQSLRTGEAAVK